MQRKHCWAWLAMMAAWAMTGCGSSSTTNSVDATTTSAQSAKDARDPKQVLTDFIDSKRKGNHGEADKLLSAKACEVLQRVQLSIVNMPADNSVKCEIKDAETIQNGGGAHVETVWSKGEGKDVEQLKTLWVLRNEDIGWRVIGIILPPLDPMSQQPMALDFEDEQQIRSFQAFMSPPPPATPGQTTPGQTTPQHPPAGTEQQPPAAATATKPLPPASETRKQ